MSNTKNREWRYFSHRELACKTMRVHVMHEPFMHLLIALRELMGIPLPVTSGYRSKEHNRKINGAQHSAHLYGCAVDISIEKMTGQQVFALVRYAFLLGFTGIHVKNHGPRKGRFIHLDYITGADVPQRLADSRPYIHTYAA